MRAVLRLACALALALVAGARPAASAEVAILKTSDVVAWRPTLDAMRRASHQGQRQRADKTQHAHRGLLAPEAG